MKIINKTLFSTVCVVLAIVVVILIAHRNSSKWSFSKNRGGTVQLLYLELSTYAHYHDGWFPRSDKGSIDALTKLYPEFATAPELAGLSGDVDAVVHCLTNGLPLQGQTSWIYIQGMRETDNPDVALLWDTNSGIYGTGVNQEGTPARGHLVVTIRGITNIVDADWSNFLEQQSKLREPILTNRAIRENPSRR